MDIPDSVLQTPYNNLNEANKELIKVAIACAKVLDSLSSSPKIRELLHNHGVVSHMERFLKSQHISLIIPMIGTIHQCANRVNDIYLCIYIYIYIYTIIIIIIRLITRYCDKKNNK